MTTSNTAPTLSPLTQEHLAPAEPVNLLSCEFHSASQPERPDACQVCATSPVECVYASYWRARVAEIAWMKASQYGEYRSPIRHLPLPLLVAQSLLGLGFSSFVVGAMFAIMRMW